MQVNVAGIRRNLKNLAHNYSDAQIKVREATSNDPWGTSSTLMSEIADLTYNVVAFSEIMQMIWKRLNDHGRNWRHVYKALVLLEYLIKTGTEKVAQQCRENIFAIETLKDFQYQEGTKDQGMNVREKAKQLVLLLRDDERLKNERARALKARERFAQASSGFGSDSHETTPTSPTFPGYSSYSTDAVSQELKTARPQTAGEEELQLQLALAMSREEAEQEEQRRRSDDVRLQLALSQSEQEYRHHRGSDARHNHLLDLLEVSLGGSPTSSGAMPSSQSAPAIGADPWGLPQLGGPSSPTAAANIISDPWSSPVMGEPAAAAIRTSPPADPWLPMGAGSIKEKDPWGSISTPPTSTPVPPTPRPADPWSPVTNQSSGGGTPGRSSSALGSPTNGDVDEFDVITNRERLGSGLNTNLLNNNTSGTISPNPFDLSPLNDSVPEDKNLKKTPASFLGENSSLVNLDNLVAAKPPSIPGGNPFAMTNPGQPNPFQQQQQQQQQPARPSINQMRHQQFVSATSTSLEGWVSPSPGGDRAHPTLMGPGRAGAASPQASNPFLA